MKGYRAFILTAIVCLSLGAFVGGYYQSIIDKCKTIADTTRTTIIDTIPFYQPIPVDSVAVRYVTISAPVQRVDVSQSVQINIDSVHKQADSVQIEIPIIQKHYTDSLYDAWISGYDCALDSIRIYNKTEYITITHQAKPKRWGIGLQGGIGITPRALQPYIGIGIHYNILTF